MPDTTPMINKIETHLNDIDKIKEGVKADIEDIFEKLNIPNFVAQPGSTVDIIIATITAKMMKRIKPIYKESKRYAKSITSEKGK